jgi:hypothetical protein
MGMDQTLLIGDFQEIELKKCSFLHTYVGNIHNKKLRWNSCETLSKKDILNLKEKLQKILSNRELAPKLLPTSKIEGCFEGINPAFTTGSVEYDSGYFYDIEYLLDFLKEIPETKLDDDNLYFSD